MLNFLRWPKRQLPPMFKCVWCERRPGVVMHHHIPLCRTCAQTLQNDIAVHGRAIQDGLAALRGSDDAATREELGERVIHHAGKLVPYEDQHLQTTIPEPTVVIHKVRAHEEGDLEVELYVEADSQD